MRCLGVGCRLAGRLDLSLNGTGIVRYRSPVLPIPASLSSRCPSLGHVAAPRGTARRDGAALVLLAAFVAAAVVLASCAPSPVAHGQPSTATAHAPQPHPLTYVAIGASDAFGVGTDDPDRQSWPTVLASQLGGPVHLINLGIPDERLSDALQNELPVALDAKPDVITVWLAANDLADGVPLDAYGRDLLTLLTTLRTRTHAVIVVGNLPDLTLLPIFAQQDPTALLAAVQAWNAVIARDCAEAGVTLVDLFSGWKELANHPEYISGDGFHPSTIGAARVADLFADAVLSAQAVRSP
jgi:acyl-CoA thioesterase I